MQVPIIISPKAGAVLERNVISIKINSLNNQEHYITHYQISKDPYNFDNHNLVYNLRTNNPKELHQAMVLPGFFPIDGYYGIRVRYNDDLEWSETVIITIKAESGWETILTYCDDSTQTTDLKNRSGILNNNHLFIFGCNNSTNGTLIDLDDPTYTKLIINDSLYKVCFIPFNHFVYRVNFNTFVIDRYDTMLNKWELVFQFTNPIEIEDDYGYFVTKEKITLVYKEKHRSNPSQINFLKLTDINIPEEPFKVESFIFINNQFDKDIYSLNSMMYLYTEYNYDVVLMTLKIPKSLDFNDTNINPYLIKFKIHDTSISLYEMEVEDLIPTPEFFFNPVYMANTNRIYWNRRDMQGESSIALNASNFKTCKAVPYGGALHLKHMLTGKLYAIGGTDRTTTKKYVKRFIE